MQLCSFVPIGLPRSVDHCNFIVLKTKVHLENGWNSYQMITEGEAAIPLETTLHAFRNQEETKQRSTITKNLK